MGMYCLAGPLMRVLFTPLPYDITFAGGVNVIAMAVYIAQLKLATHGQRWGAGMALLILSWILFYPLAVVFMRIALGAKRYELPKPIIPINIVREPAPLSSPITCFRLSQCAECGANAQPDGRAEGVSVPR